MNPDEIDESSEESFPASDPPAWTVVTGPHAAAAAEPHAPGEVEHLADEHRFVLRMPEGDAQLVYERRGSNVLALLHTEVPKAAEGKGAASRLAHEALEYARASKLRIVPACPFVRAYLKRHTEYADLVARS